MLGLHYSMLMVSSMLEDDSLGGMFSLPLLLDLGFLSTFCFFGATGVSGGVTSLHPSILSCKLETLRRRGALGAGFGIGRDGVLKLDTGSSVEVL